MVKCPFAVPTCKCYDCACNASYDECNHGYCITCFECLNESKAVHNIYLCKWWQMEMKILNELAGMLEDINPNEIVSHILDGTLLPWLASWKMKSQMLVAFLLENEKARLSEKD